MKKSVFVILLVFFISAFSISMYFVVKETVEDKKQYEVFENIVSSVQVEDDSSDTICTVILIRSIHITAHRI